MTDAAQNVLERVTEPVVTEYVSQLVRRPSENPPGDYVDVADWTRAEFEGIGLHDVKTVEGETGRINVVGHLPGSNAAPESSLCLASHTDVVSAGDHSKWKYDPFDPKIVDG